MMWLGTYEQNYFFAFVLYIIKLNRAKNQIMFSLSLSIIPICNENNFMITLSRPEYSAQSSHQIVLSGTNFGKDPQVITPTPIYTHFRIFGSIDLY